METSHPNTRAVQITHIARDVLYETEKPYAADFSAPEKTGNHIFEVKDILIKDARPNKDNFRLEKNGFCLLNSPILATFESLSYNESDVLAYYQQMEALVLERFPEYSKVVVLEHQLRKRDVGYPEAVENTYNQPARLVHHDFTTRGLVLRMKLSFPNKVNEYINKDMDFLNIWRVLSGPNNDWPLGICDYTYRP
ncbi:uncharacterized protein LY89DRAFT_290130 [Mollisia scopiformis]|uniref:Uncharacterized protein n=1 Tax=Mollisia scopiformis TaxID=149040 RepID=A0A194XR67_MOLSC|nr:uncharacterized protein LY89DRAFT_290130 [Mollisia scopiformis]KUJ22222.1 hypothetical protein LY89DRAFT_290130 [Mollisia scopiformis]